MKSIFKNLLLACSLLLICQILNAGILVLHNTTGYELNFEPGEFGSDCPTAFLCSPQGIISRNIKPGQRKELNFQSRKYGQRDFKVSSPSWKSKNKSENEFTVHFKSSSEDTTPFFVPCVGEECMKPIKITYKVEGNEPNWTITFSQTEF